LRRPIAYNSILKLHATMALNCAEPAQFHAGLLNKVAVAATIFQCLAA